MAVATPAEDSPSIALGSPQGIWIIVATAMGSGMVFLDGTVVNVALPRIQTDLTATLAGVQWVVNGYTLFLAAFLLLGGDLGDKLGRRGIFAAGLVLFVLASAGCALAPTLNTLVAARIVQGLGGALLVPGSLAMIKAVIASQDSGRAIGLWAGLSGVTTAIGPLVGGFLVDAVSWRAVFLINVPLGIITLYATLRHIPPNRDPHAPPGLDWMGAACTVVGLSGLTYGLIEGPGIGWDFPLVLISLVVGVLGLVAFPLWENRTGYPMVPLGVFRSRNFTGANLATLGMYFAFTGTLLFLVLDLQQVQGYSPLEAGAATLPLSILLLLLSPRVGGLMHRVGARLFMTAGAVIVALGLAIFATIGHPVSYPFHLLPALIVMGFGMSLFVTPLTTTVMSSVPNSLVGVASGTNNAVSRIASLLAVAIMGIIVAARFDTTLAANLHHSSLPPPARQSILAHQDRLGDTPVPASLPPAQRTLARQAIDSAFVDGFRWAMGFCAVLCLVVAALSWLMIRKEE